MAQREKEEFEDAVEELVDEDMANIMKEEVAVGLVAQTIHVTEEEAKTNIMKRKGICIMEKHKALIEEVGHRKGERRMGEREDGMEGETREENKRA